MRELLLRFVSIGAALAWPALGMAQEPSGPGLGEESPTATASSSSSTGSASSSGSSGSAQVARAVFSLSVVDREPQQVVSALDGQAERVFFFTELVGLDGQTVKHIWRYNGQVMAEIPFSVSGTRWRAYSSKRVFPGAEGRWTVSVVDASGNVLNESSLGSAYAGGESAPQPPPAATDSDARP